MTCFVKMSVSTVPKVIVLAHNMSTTRIVKSCTGAGCVNAAIQKYQKRNMTIKDYIREKGQ